jgi:hypothetical protein
MVPRMYTDGSAVSIQTADPDLPIQVCDSGFNLRSLLQQAGDVRVSSMSVSGSACPSLVFMEPPLACNVSHHACLRKAMRRDGERWQSDPAPGRIECAIRNRSERCSI